MTNLILAQAAAGPSINELWIVLGAVAVVASIAGNYAQWVISRRKKETRTILPDPLRTKQVFEPVSAEECRERHQSVESQIQELRQSRIMDAKDAALSRKGVYEQIAGVRTEMVQMERRINSENETRVDKVHDRINDVLTAVSRLEGKIDRA